MRALLATIIFFSLTQIALGQEAEGVAKGLLDSFPALGKILIYVVSAQIVLRAAAEALTRIAATTESKTDNKIASYLSQAAWLIGSLLGKFGYSVPKLVIEAQAKKINEKSAE